MCGILGSNFYSNNLNIGLESLHKRGPDYQKLIEFDNFYFAHARLSIIDIDNEANQPMIFDDIVIVFNGEIYNYKELIHKEELVCVTSSDTEVIIRLYQKYGYDFLNKLNGMFSFVLYDKSKKEFFCARDRYGKKPFFYYYVDGKFIFSSSIKSIINILGFTPKLNKVALSQYLQYFVSLNCNTFYTNINKLEAASYMIVNSFSLKTKKYYKINTYKRIHDESTAIKDIEELLFKSIEYRLVSDVDVACLLSGGVDSSLVSSIYSKISNKKIDTFSVGYEGYDNYSELKYANIVAKNINSNHHPLMINKQDFLDSFDNTMDALEEPHGDSAAIPLNCLCKTIHQSGFKSVLSGEGSDELFLGYDNYFKFLKYYNFKESLNSGQNEFLTSIISALQNNTKESEYLRRVLSKESIYNSFGEIFTTIQKKKLFNKVPTFKQENSKSDPVDWMSYIDLKIWLGQALLSKVDRISMNNSLEVRTPFLDFNLVNYAFSIDSSVKIGNTNKYLIKKIANKYLPDSIVYRTKKGFNSPYNEWLFQEFDNLLLDKVLYVNDSTNLFNKDYLIKLYNLAKTNKFKQHFWSIYIFSIWFEKNYL